MSATVEADAVLAAAARWGLSAFADTIKAMSAPRTEDSFSRAMRNAESEILAFHDAGLSPTFAVEPQYRLLFEVTYPLASHAIEQVKAARLLIDGGHPYAAETNARAAYEHAITVSWMQNTPGAAEAVAQEMRRQARADLLVFASADVQLPDHLREIAESPITSSGPARHFHEMCDAFGTEPRGTYWRYRKLSDSVHPSLGTVAQHLRMGSDTATLVPWSKRTPSDDLVVKIVSSSVVHIQAVGSPR